MSSLRLLIDCRMYRSSGIGVYLENILKRLGEFVPEDRITLLSLPGHAAALSRCMPGARVHLLSSPIYTIREQWELLSKYFSQRTVWWSPHFNIPLAHRGPLVVTVHDLFHLRSEEVRRKPLQLAYAKTMFSAVRRLADKIICVSHFTASELERLVGAREAQVDVIHNGLDGGWLEPVAGASMQLRPYFLFVGNVKPHKNVRGLVQAFASIADRIPHDLVIVGQRSGFITGDAESVQLAGTIGSRVHFTGFVELQELRRWYAHATALVFPSFYEGFGFPPLEAMAVRCPVIASNAASMPEVCGDAVLYCDPADVQSISRAMVELAHNPRLRDTLIEKGVQQATKYSWADAAARTGAVLRSLM